ncbi:MAG: phage tail tape measure protein, partial [Gammaproteobacteria bacterium]|nr:phage tail tape measure protein [Gammaproteobacteria bacterium]
MEALRELYIAIKLVDDVTKPLKQLNKSVDKFKNTVKSATKPVEELRDKYLNMSAAFDQSLSSSKYFFTQMDLATKEAIIRAKQLPKPIQDIAIAFERVKTKVSEFADVVRSKFSGITKFIENYRLAIAGLGAALTGVGLGGLKIFGESAKDFERAILEMKARTHMTTKEFEEMVNTLKQLAKVNSDSFQTISQVLTIVNERFGELGTKTKIVAQAILDFAKITGSDAVSAANSLSVVMKAYNIPATKIYEVTDILISAQQRFGVSAARLAELLYNNGAAMRKLGLTFNETVAILAAMESKGVNISRALLGLRSAIDKIGGTDNFRKVLRELASIQDKSERTRRALEIFGSYAGPGIAAILDNGINGLNKYLLKLDEVRGTTLKASATIDQSLSEQLGILRNNLNLLKVELGTALLPVLKSVVKIVKRFVDAIQTLPAPVKGVLATLTALITIMSAVVGPILVQIAAISWLGSSLSQIIEVLSAVRFAMIGFASSVWTTLAPLLPLIAIIGAAVGAILILQDVLVKGWEKSYLGKFVNWLLKKLPFLKPIAEAVENAINWLRQGFDWLAKSIGETIHWIQQAIDWMGPLKYLLLGPVGPIVYLISHIDKLESATSSALSAIKSAWDATIGFIIAKINEFIAKVKQVWDFIAKSPIGKIAEFAFSLTPIGAGINFAKTITHVVKPGMTHELTRMTSTPIPITVTHPTAQPISTYHIRHEHKTINVPKIEIRVEGVRDTEKVAELVIR